MIKLPKDFAAAGCKFDFAIPVAKLETAKTPEGFEFRVAYETNEIQEFIQRAVHEMNEKIEVAIMDELLRLNGYVPERTCQWKHIEGTWFMCECGKRHSCVIPDNFCSNCGARVVKNDS